MLNKTIKYIIAILLLITSSQVKSQKIDGLSPEFHKNRRDAFRSKMDKNSVAVFFPNPIRNRSNDVDYVYHQDPNFYYLTGLKETDAVLLIFSEKYKEKTSEILYISERNSSKELWTGKTLGVKGAKSKLKLYTEPTINFIENPINFKKFNKVYLNKIKEAEFRNFSDKTTLSFLKEKFKLQSDYDKFLSPLQKNLYQKIKLTPLNETHKILFQIKGFVKVAPELSSDTIVKAFQSAEKMIDYAKVLKRMTKKQNCKTNINLSFIKTKLAEMREIKTKEELFLLKKAIDISAIGQIEMMKAMRPNISEREIQGVHEFVYKKYGAEYEGYPSIVGAGHNGCVLHYIKNNKPHAKDGELVLMDLGAEYRGYTADVTRTIPTNGKFSPEQKAIYEIVLEAQTEGIKECIVGNRFRQPGRKATQIINEGLAKLGIIKSSTESHRYFPHGTSHYLGLDVHDMGTYGRLKHNSVITVEPGIYIPEGSNCDKKWWGISIRIEDDILITDKGPVNMSRRAPRTIGDIEKMMKKHSVLKKWKLPKLN